MRNIARVSVLVRVKDGVKVKEGVRVGLDVGVSFIPTPKVT